MANEVDGLLGQLRNQFNANPQNRKGMQELINLVTSGVRAGEPPEQIIAKLSHHVNGRPDLQQTVGVLMNALSSQKVTTSSLVSAIKSKNPSVGKKVDKLK